MINRKHNLLTRMRPILLITALLLPLVISSTPRAARAQSRGRNDTVAGLRMLNTIKNEVKNNYYDPTFHGINFEAHFKEAEEQIKKADSNGQIFGILALSLMKFDDSHTYFVPPGSGVAVEYGWRVQLFGDACHITAVLAGSDAEAKGLKRGDLVHFIDEMKPTREDLWKIKYLYYVLRPKTRVELIVQSPGDQPRKLELTSKAVEEGRVKEEKVAEDQEKRKLGPGKQPYYEVGEELIIWRMPGFDLYENDLDEMMNKVRKYKALVLDLRGNGGGSEDKMLRLIGHFIERDVKVGELVRRKQRKPLVAKTLGDRVFKGKLIVLVDSESASAAEVFARVMQLEKRGTVVGDRTAGAVRRGLWIGHTVYDVQDGASNSVRFAVSVTDADIVMADGKSLEHVGVTPDTLMLPTAEDLAARRDPVLSQALSRWRQVGRRESGRALPARVAKVKNALRVPARRNNVSPRSGGERGSDGGVLRGSLRR